MAKPYKEITKSEFRDNYNVVKILNDRVDIMRQLSTFNSEKQAVAFGVRKPPKVTLNDVMLEIKDIKVRLNNIEDRLDNIVKKNRLIE